MPREARKKSETNIYHVILRGINRQVIFEDDGDRHYFMSLMKYCKELSDFKLYAFCLMGNHVHLLLETGKEPLGLIFKRIGSRYVAWYNWKYQRTGHLFQDRFRSEAVEDGQYFMTVLRYILQNPMKAGMENCPGSWRWSSYLAYEKGNGSITDTEYAIGLFEGRDQLLNYVKLGNEDAVMDEERFDWRLRDERAKEIVERVSGCATVAEFQGLEKSRKKKYVRELYQENLTLGQITRLTGVPKTTVDRTVRGLHARPQAEPETPVLFEASDFEYDPGDVEIW